MEVRADRAPEPAALEAALAVVAEAGDDAAERLGARVEARAAGVVLEARDRAHVAGLELGLEQHVADHPPLAGDRLERQQPDARHLLAVEAAVAAPEQLVAAADREQRRAAAVHGFASAAPPSSRGSRRRGTARGPGRRRRSRGRARRGRSRRPGRAASRRARARATPRAARARRCCRGRRRCSGSRDRGGRRGSSRGALPVRLRVAARGDEPLQREHRGVGRQHDELAAVGREREPAIERRSRSGSTTMRDSSRPPYLKRSASSAARSPVATTVSSPARSGSKSTSQIHETSRPSAIAVVQRDDGDRRRAAVDERAHRLVRAGRILDQKQKEPLAVDRDPLEAAERGAEAARARRRSRRASRRARARASRRRARCRRCRGPGSASSTRRVPSGVTRSNDGALEALELDGARRRPRAAAARGRSSGSGSRRGGRRTRRRRDTACRSGCSTSSRRRAGATGRATDGSSSP